MKANPDEKSLLSKLQLSQSQPLSMRSRTIKKEESFKWRSILRGIVEGKVVTVVLSIVTIFALFGVKSTNLLHIL